MFNLPIESDINYLLDEIGNNGVINGVENTSLIINNTSSTLNDDKKVISLAKINSGDYIRYASSYFIVVNEILDIRFRNYYKGHMSSANHISRWIDDGNLKVYPMRLEYDNGYVEEGIIKIPIGNMIGVIQVNKDTDKIKIGDRFIFGKYAFKVEGIDFTRKGLYRLQLNKTSGSSEDDLKNGVANRYEGDNKGNDRLKVIPKDFDKPTFEYKDNGGEEPEPTPVDKDELKKAIQRAKDKLDDGEDYKEETLKALTDAKDQGERVLANSKATQEAVDKAVIEIDDAIADLELVEDKPFKDFAIKGRDTLSFNRLSEYEAVGTEGHKVEWTIDNRDVANFHNIEGNKCMLVTYYKAGIVTLSAIIPTKPIVQVDKKIIVSL